MILSKNPIESKKTAIIIEFNEYHTECIYPQVEYLKESGYSVQVICSQKILSTIDYLTNICQVNSYDFKKLHSYIKLWWYLLKRKDNPVIILNTAHGSRALKFMLLPFLSKLKINGIVHNMKKLETSKGQQLISRKIFRYLVIADYLAETKIAKAHNISSINTSYFPSLELNESITKRDEIWITIPGNIETKRRDYHWLIDVCSDRQLNKNIKFILLGNSKKGDGNEIITRILSSGLENHFIWFDSFIGQDTFNTYIHKSDYLLPLLHEGKDEYLKYKISGIFSISEAFSKPMILHSNFKILNKYYCTEFYSNIAEFIHLISHQPNIKCKPFDFDRNRIQYLEALQLI